MVQEARDFEALRAELEARTRELQMGGGGEVDRSLEERKAAGPPGLGQHRVEKVLEANRLWPATPVSPDVEGIETFPTLEEVEREYIVRVLAATSWRISGPRGAARILGLNASTLRSRMKKLGITRDISRTLG